VYENDSNFLYRTSIMDEGAHIQIGL
jgi:hypothetical protein